MVKIREIEANPHTKAVAVWYSVTRSEADEITKNEVVNYKTPSGANFESDYLSIHFKSGKEILASKGVIYYIVI